VTLSENTFHRPESGDRWDPEPGFVRRVVDARDAEGEAVSRMAFPISGAQVLRGARAERVGDVWT
jgi:hypothetical protein